MQDLKILITGSDGMLGSQFASDLKNFFSIFTLPKGIDIRIENSLKDELQKINPDIIIHTAAYTDVDGCELDPNKAYQVNVVGTENIVKFCRLINENTKLIFISSTGIYGDNSINNYSEDDTPQPTTIHHKNKLEAENIIRNNLHNFMILRVGWLYGGFIYHKNNFVYKRYLEAKNKKIIYSSTGQIGNPTNCQDVVRQTFHLIQNEVEGIFNCVNGGAGVSRHEYVEEIVKLFGLDCKIKMVDETFFQRAAPVSSNESAINKKLNSMGLNIMPFWKESLESYINEIKCDI